MQHAKQLIEELNKALDDLNAPPNIKDRSAILSKILQIPKQQAWGLLEGHIIPDKEILQKIATELEIDVRPFENHSK